MVGLMHKVQTKTNENYVVKKKKKIRIKEIIA